MVSVVEVAPNSRRETCIGHNLGSQTIIQLMFRDLGKRAQGLAIVFFGELVKEALDLSHSGFNVDLYIIQSQINIEVRKEKTTI